MKCNSCGAVNGPSKSECEFCGVSTVPDNLPGTDGSSNKTSVPQITFFADALNLIKELNATPSDAFKWMAFFFPIPYLWGYRARDNALKVAAVVYVPSVVIILLAVVSYRLATIAYVITIIWRFFVDYLVATRTKSLIPQGRTFDMGQAIIAVIVELVVYFILVRI